MIQLKSKTSVNNEKSFNEHKRDSKTVVRNKNLDDFVTTGMEIYDGTTKTVRENKKCQE